MALKSLMVISFPFRPEKGGMHPTATTLPDPSRETTVPDTVGVKVPLNVPVRVMELMLTVPQKGVVDWVQLPDDVSR